MIQAVCQTSLQAQILVPLAASLAFGLLAATLIVLFVLPAICAILDDLGLGTLAAARKTGGGRRQYGHSPPHIGHYSLAGAQVRRIELFAPGD